MTAHSAHNLSTVDRPLGLRARNDLEQVAVNFAQQTTYVVKDPLTLELLHLTAEEYFLFQSLQSSTSLSELQKEFEREFAPRRISPAALQQGINNLYAEGLLLSETSGQGQELLQRGQQRQRKERLQSLLQLLSFKIGSIDATQIVDRLHRSICWVFSTPTLLLAIAIVLYAVWVLLSQGNELASRLPGLNELARPENWLLWLATFVVVKVIHELAHAVACQHLGGRCHEIGVLLLACVPCLYCDVSDIWRLPNKWQRIAVSSAGMIVEIVIASAALIAWWYTQPGLLNTWCLSLVLVCSVGTLLINANPLLRYDGYYILSDLVEVPNLAGRAQGLLPQKLRRWLLAEPPSIDPLLTQTQRRGLAVYAVASRIYITLVILSIFAVLLAWARPYRLENLIYTLAVVTIFGILARPLIAVWKMFSNPSLRARLRIVRVTTLLTGLAAILAAILFIPIKHSVTGPVVLVPVEGKTVYASSAGELRYAVEPGTQVKRGDLIARLVNPEMEINLTQQQGTYAVNLVRYNQLNTLRAIDPQLQHKLPTAQEALHDSQQQLQEIRQQTEELLIHAPVDGTVIRPPAVEPTSVQNDLLPKWSGSPLEPKNLGCWIEPGTVLCTVADPQNLEALLALDQADVPEVQPGQRVRLLLEAAPLKIVEGEVLQVATRAAIQPQEQLPAADEKMHLVQIKLDQQLPTLMVAGRGTAKIEVSRRTIGARITSELQRLLHLPW